MKILLSICKQNYKKTRLLFPNRDLVVMSNESGRTIK